MFDLSVLRSLLERHGQTLGSPVAGFSIGGRPFDFNRRPALVGVINLSEDSWYRESICATEQEAIQRGQALAAGGADLVDIGAESTLPDAKKVSPAQQAARLAPVVEALSRQGILVSVEGYHPEVLEAAGRAGACVFNLTGAHEPAEALRLARRFDAAVVFCYLQGQNPREVTDFRFAEDMMAEMEGFFRERTELAKKLGVPRCILDPGLGFYYPNLQDGKTRVNHQISTLLQTFRLNQLGFPTMNVLPHAPEIFGDTHRRAAEPFFAVLAMLGGTHLIRTHELEVVARIREVLALYPAHGG